MRLFCLITLSISLLLSLSCSGNGGSIPLGGGPSTIKTYPGTATCTEITRNEWGFQAHFAYKPSDPNAVSQYLFPGNDSNIILFRDGIGEPTSDWLTANGVVVGVELACNRRECSGNCTPVYFTFPTIPGTSAQ